MPGLWAAGDGCTIFGGVKRSMMGAPGGARGAAAPGAGSGGGAPSGAPGGAPGASATSTNILSTEGIPNDGLSNAILSGYQAGINAGNYLKNL
jgi:hypothetical protein